MTEHIQRKHKVQSIDSKTEFNKILDDAMLSDTERRIVEMIYLEHKDNCFIADALGLAEVTVRKKHKKAIKKISNLI